MEKIKILMKLLETIKHILNNGGNILSILMYSLFYLKNTFKYWKLR